MADTGTPRREHRTLDCIGLYCPTPVLKTREEIDKIAIGDTLEVLADDPAAEEDIKRFAKRTGHEIVSFENKDNRLRFLIRKTK